MLLVGVLKRKKENCKWGGRRGGGRWGGGRNWENVNLRINEHQRDVRLKHVTQSALSEHNIEIGHQILFDKTTTIANITSYFSRKYRESIEKP